MVDEVDVVDAVDDERTGSQGCPFNPGMPVSFQEKPCTALISIVYFFDYLNACLCPVALLLFTTLFKGTSDDGCAHN